MPDRAASGRRSQRAIRLALKLLVAVFAFLASFALLLAVFDTKRASPPPSSADAGFDG